MTRYTSINGLVALVFLHAAAVAFGGEGECRPYVTHSMPTPAVVVNELLDAQASAGYWGEGPDQTLKSAIVLNALITYSLTDAHDQGRVRESIISGMTFLSRAPVASGSSAHYAGAAVFLNAQRFLCSTATNNTAFVAIPEKPESLSAKFFQLMLALQQPGEPSDSLPLPTVKSAVQQFTFFDAVTPDDIEPSLRQHLRTIIHWARLRQRLGDDYLDEMWRHTAGTSFACNEIHKAFYLLTCQTFVHKIGGPHAVPYGRLSSCLQDVKSTTPIESAPSDKIEINFLK